MFEKVRDTEFPMDLISLSKPHTKGLTGVTWIKKKCHHGRSLPRDSSEPWSNVFVLTSSPGDYFEHQGVRYIGLQNNFPESLSSLFLFFEEQKDSVG